MVGGIAILNHVLEVVVIRGNVRTQELSHHRTTGGIASSVGLLHIVSLGEKRNGELNCPVACRRGRGSRGGGSQGSSGRGGRSAHHRTWGPGRCTHHRCWSSKGRHHLARSPGRCTHHR